MSGRVLIVSRDGEILDAARMIASDARCRVEVRDTFDGADRYDLVIVDGERLSEARGVMAKHVMILADPRSWCPTDDAGLWGIPEILWKPIDPERLLGKIRQLLP